MHQFCVKLIMLNICFLSMLAEELALDPGNVLIQGWVGIHGKFVSAMTSSNLGWHMLSESWGGRLACIHIDLHFSTLCIGNNKQKMLHDVWLKKKKRNFLSFCMIEFFHSPSFQIQRGFHGNGFMVPQDTKLDFGTLGALPLEVTSTECASRSDFASNNQVSGHTSPISTSKKAGKRCNRAR
jgi:hypothetical protein